MKWENTLENKYYFAKSELFVNLKTMTEAVLVMLIWVVYEFFMWQLGNVLVGIMLELVFGYLLFCCYKAYNNEKVKALHGKLCGTNTMIHKRQSVSKGMSVRHLKIPEGGLGCFFRLNLCRIDYSGFF
ncbi:MAG: hypothetical protein IKQ25_02950 [Lachnospiraceae bacterium]|nr:hypothetical protein [Lachnospiraceae bacterium]